MLRTTARIAGVRLLATLALPLVALSSGACSGLDGERVAGPSRIAGRIRADRIPPDAIVQVYRDVDGPAVPVVGATARPDELGRFETPSLVPGRYVVVLRTRENPPSTTTAVVPGRTDVDLRLASPGAGSTVTLVAARAAPGSTATPAARTCRLVPAEPRTGIPDRREVVLLPGQEVRLSGLAPGVWHVDVMPDGATADFVVPQGEEVPRFLIDPPEFPGAGAKLDGSVFRLRGEAAFGAAVTARPATFDGSSIQPWGRVGLVDADGRYSIGRLPAGTVYVRVESRDASFWTGSGAELIRISPSEKSERAYVIEP